MRIVLLVLSGDSDQAREWLQESYPGASIERISRGELEGQTSLRRLSVLRSFRPDILAVATERLVWQSGQTALLLLDLSRARVASFYLTQAAMAEKRRGRRSCCERRFALPVSPWPARWQLLVRILLLKT